MRWQVLGIAAAFLSACEAQKYRVGCLLHGIRFAPAAAESTAQVVNASNPYDCQTACAWDTRCTYFSYEAELRRCFLVSRPLYAMQRSGFISGPPSCKDGWGNYSSCSALPGPDFPGINATKSFEAWPMHLVPLRLQCWPRGGITGEQLLPCGDGAVQVLEDTVLGWPGKCMGLKQVTLEAGVSCRQKCEQDLWCPAWQEVEEGDNRTSCWQGLGYDCWDAKRALPVRQAQRLARGSYRILMTLAHYEVSDLRNVFDASMFGRNIPVAEAVCRRMCLSLLSCEIWQYSTRTGCWMSDPSYREVPYPPTTASFQRGTDAAQYMVTGQYIQRVCKAEGLQGPVPTPKPPATVAPGSPLVTSPTAAPTSMPSSAEAATGESSRFIKGMSGGATYFEDTKAKVKHLVRSGCGACGLHSSCTTAVVVSDALIEGLRTGEDFQCYMLEGGSLQVGQKDVAVQGKTSSPTPASSLEGHATSNASVIQSSTLTPAVANKSLIHGFPWYGWLLLTAVPCCVGVGLLPLIFQHPKESGGTRSVKLGPCSCDDPEADVDSQEDTADAASNGWLSTPRPCEVQGREPASPCAGTAGLLATPVPPWMALPRSPGVGLATPPKPPPGTAPWDPARIPMLQAHGAASPGVSAQEFDLITVTPRGIEVTPLEGLPPPGVPMLNPVPN